jgi:hypothetical protein
MHIEKDFTPWIAETVDQMALNEPVLIEHKCPHCGVPIRFPVIAKKWDVDRLTDLLNSIYSVMDNEHLADIMLAKIRECCMKAMKRPR